MRGANSDPAKTLPDDGQRSESAGSSQFVEDAAFGRGGIGNVRTMGTSMHNQPDLDNLLLEITRCPNLVEARSDCSHACACIVQSQRCGVDEFQVPEPWSGHIDTAPILFVGSNPSISQDNEFPNRDWSDSKTISYFQGRFDKECTWVTPEKFNKVPFWTGVRARAKRATRSRSHPRQGFRLD